MGKGCCECIVAVSAMDKFWKEFYKPESTEEEWHPLFAEALQNKSKISYLVDMLMFGTDEEILDFYRTEGRR